MDKHSTVKFLDISEKLHFNKILYNDVILYDEFLIEESEEHYNKVIYQIRDKFIYKIILDIIQQNKLVLKIIGEKL